MAVFAISNTLGRRIFHCFLYDYVLPGPHLFANAGYRYDPFLPPADSLMLDRFVAGPFF